MNKSILLIAPLLAAFAASPALADKGGNGHGKGKAKHHDVARDHDRPVVVVRHEDRPVVVVRDRDYYRDRDYRYSDRHEGHPPGRHLGWHKNHWKRGDRIDWQYVQPTYYVTDYRVYHLRQPPVGYRWVRPMDDRYLLVNIATGLIADALGY